MKNEKGITLSILIITIIVMLIVAGIVFLGSVEDATINKAQNVVDLNKEVEEDIKNKQTELLKSDTVSFSVE